MKIIVLPFVFIILIVCSCSVHNYYIYEADLPKDNYNKSIIYQDSAIICYFSSYTWVESDGLLMNNSFVFTLFVVSKKDSIIEINDIVSEISAQANNKDFSFSDPTRIEYHGINENNESFCLSDTVVKFPNFKRDSRIIHDSTYISYYDFCFTPPDNIEKFNDIDRLKINIRIILKGKIINAEVLLKKKTYHDIISPINH